MLGAVNWHRSAAARSKLNWMCTTPDQILPFAILPGASLGPAAVAGLYLWNPLLIAAAVGGSPAGLENAAVFAALAGESQPLRALQSAHMIPRSDTRVASMAASFYVCLELGCSVLP